MLSSITLTGWFWGDGKAHKVTSSIGWFVKHIDELLHYEEVEEMVYFEWDSGAYLLLGEDGGSVEDLAELVSQYGEPSTVEAR